MGGLYDLTIMGVMSTSWLSLMGQLSPGGEGVVASFHPKGRESPVKKSEREHNHVCPQCSLIWPLLQVCFTSQQAVEHS